MKLFLGRLPIEVTERDIRTCFEDYGRVVEVFKMKGESPGERRHSMYHEDGFTCAFVRVSSLKMAEDCIEELHEQRCLIAEKRHFGAMQVAFAKGEAARLGLSDTREILPHRMEAKERVRMQREKGILLGAASQILGAGRINLMLLSEAVLRSIITRGLEQEEDEQWRMMWHSYAQGGFGGTIETEASEHDHNSLAQFIAMRTFDYKDVPWFKAEMQRASSQFMLGDVPGGGAPLDGGGTNGNPHMDPHGSAPDGQGGGGGGVAVTYKTHHSSGVPAPSMMEIQEEEFDEPQGGAGAGGGQGGDSMFPEHLREYVDYGDI